MILKKIFNRIVRMSDQMFAGLWIWRKLRGGMFYRIELAVVPSYGTFWVRETVGWPEIIHEEVCY